MKQVADVPRAIARNGTRMAAAVEGNPAVAEALIATAEHAIRVAARAGCSLEELEINAFLTRAGKIVVHIDPPGKGFEHCPECGRAVDLDDEQLRALDPDDEGEPCYECGAFVDDRSVL